MNTIKNVFCLATAITICGCGGGSGGTTTYTVTKTVPPPVVLAATNGDMSKYLGTWSSECGTDIVAKTSTINKFTLTALAGEGVTGTLTSQTYRSLDCASGTDFGFAAPQKIKLTYQANLPINVTDSQGTVFSGNADKVNLSLVDALQSTNINIGFVDGFSKFKLNTNGSFSGFDLTYRKSSF